MPNSHIEIPSVVKCPIKTAYIPNVCVMCCESTLIQKRFNVNKIPFKKTLSEDVTHFIVDKNGKLTVTILTALLRKIFIFEEDCKFLLIQLRC